MSTGFTPTTFSFKPAPQTAFPNAVVQINSILVQYESTTSVVSGTVYESSAQLAAANPLDTFAITIPNSDIQTAMTTLIADLVAAAMSGATNSGSTVSAANAVTF